MPERVKRRVMCNDCSFGANPDCRGRVAPEWYPPQQIGAVDIAYVGEAPGEDENDSGRPFVGPSGQILRQALEQLPPHSFVITNSCQCLPPRKGSKLSKPGVKEIKACASLLQGVLEKAKPKMIVALGGTALRALTGRSTGITKVAGSVIDGDPPIYAMNHPSFVLHRESAKADLEQQFDRLGTLIKTGCRKPELDVEWRWAKTRKEAADILRDMTGGLPVSFDYETEGLDPFIGEIVCVAFCKEPGYAYTIPWGLLDIDKYKKWLRSRTLKIAHNCMFEMLWSKVKVSVWPEHIVSDPMIKSFTINENPPHSLSLLSKRHTDIGGYDDEVNTLLASGVMHHEMPENKLYLYNAGDVDATLRLDDVLTKLMTKTNKWQHDKILLPAAKMLVRMMYNGIAIDLSVLEASRTKIAQGMRTARGKMRKHPDVSAWERTAGLKLNPRSHKQLVSLLFKHLKLPVIGKSHQTGAPSTKDEFMKPIEHMHPVVPLLLEFRGHDAMREFLDVIPKNVKPTGMIHPTFNPVGTVTGQITCKNPNVMGIPAEGGNPIKRSFVSRFGKDGEIGSADYSQLELRLIASDSGDAAMCDAFDHGLDMHTWVASMLFEVPIDQVTWEQRYLAKRMNFGMINQMSPAKLARMTGMTKDEAVDFMAQYFARLPGIDEWRKAVRNKAQSLAYVDSWFGLRRHLPEVNSNHWAEYDDAMRRAVSFRIQSTGRQLCLLGGLGLERRIEEADVDGEIVLCNTVHDQCILDYLCKHRELVRRIVQGGMVDDVVPHIPMMKVPLVVDFKCGPNWGDIK